MSRGLGDVYKRQILRRTKVAYYAQVRSTTMKGIAHVLIYGL